MFDKSFTADFPKTSCQVTWQTRLAQNTNASSAEWFWRSYLLSLEKYFVGQGSPGVIFFNTLQKKLVLEWYFLEGSSLENAVVVVRFT